MQNLPLSVIPTAIDIDVTDDCNLRCVYCFKGPKTPRYTDLKTVRNAINWIIEASSHVSKITVNLMGGEPLLCWDIIKEIVPWAKKRASSFNKDTYISMTTNLTLMNDEIRRFVDEYGMGILMSIDGSPEIHNAQRCPLSPEHNFDLVEKWAKDLLRTRPRSDARMTLVPKNVSKLSKGFEYLVNKIGFQSVMISPAEYPDWTEEYFMEYKYQLNMIATFIKNAYLQKRILKFNLFHWYIKKLVHPSSQGVKNLRERVSPCGAGYNYLMIDFNGDIWPCHRFDNAIQKHNLDKELKMGNLYLDGFNDGLAHVFQTFNFLKMRPEKCMTCSIQEICCGGCPAANLYYTKNIYLPHENVCKLHQIEYEVAENLYNDLIKMNLKSFEEDLKHPF